MTRKKPPLTAKRVRFLLWDLPYSIKGFYLTKDNVLTAVFNSRHIDKQGTDTTPYTVKESEQW